MSASKLLPKRLRSPAGRTILALIGLFVSIACATSTSVSPTSVPAVPTSAPSAPSSPTAAPTATSTPITARAIAEDISAGVGQVTQVSEGDPGRVVMVFEEIHTSRAGQIEIAIMLNRLYEDYGLRVIGLEGAFTIDGVLGAEWFHFPPPFKARDPIRTREDVIVQLLEEGEISSGEMMALIYSDLTVSGIDNKVQYNYEPPEDAYVADTWYLIQIAVQGMTQKEIDECDKLYDPDNDETIVETIECYIYSDEWTGEKYDLLNDLTDIHSCREYFDALTEIETKADEVDAEVTSEDEKSLRALKKFYEMCMGRDEVMANAVLDLVDQYPDAPVAMTIGAAHTAEVTKLFAEAGVSFAVVRCNALADHAENGDLHYQTYDRKNQAQSVDAGGEFSLVGALLEGRKKPTPVIDGEVWLRSKADIYFIADRLAHAVRAGETDLDRVADELPELENASVDRGSIEIVGDKVVFSVEALDSDGEKTTIWIGAHTDREKAMLLEERLSEALDYIQSLSPPDHDSPEPEPSHPVRITYDTVMWAAGTREELNTLMTP